jgi:tetratricopeptide (TPR) repeat protein
VPSVPSDAMADVGGGTAVEDALAALRTGASDAEVLDLVQAACVEFVSEDVIHRLVPHAARLAALDYEGHPWAALPAGVAVCAIDRPLGRSILRSGRERLEALEARSAALAWFLEGLQDMGEGNLDGATAWWNQAHASLDPSLTATRLTLAHLALGAYERGSLDEAIVLAQEALWTAEQVGDSRTESLAAIYLGFFHLYTGRFGLVDGLT